jgi:hypothetical protein
MPLRKRSLRRARKRWNHTEFMGAGNVGKAEGNRSGQLSNAQ